ncbi:MAG: EXLDI protein [Dehalococcoidia bacterium]|nr:EXLDI protein [Dehalococcoidia bacterium]
MPNKTIYVSQNDISVFDEAQQIAGEAMSSVIAKALREYVARHQEKSRGMREISVRVGGKDAQREQRFVAIEMGKWKGVSDDKQWWMETTIYNTQKGNWAVLLDYKGKTMLTREAWQDPNAWGAQQRFTELAVSERYDDWQGKLPVALVRYIVSLAEKEQNPVDYLDI